MKKLLTLLFIISISSLSLWGQVQPSPSYLQKQNNVWPFDGGGFNFNSSPVSSLPVSFTSAASSCISSVCDSNGNLLFYTDGYGIYEGNPPPGNYTSSSNNYYMPSAYPILPYTYNVSPVGATWQQGMVLNYPAVDGSVIVPIIDSPGKYYVFYNEVDPYLNYFYGYCKLYYSVVDMALNSGYGDIEPGRKNVAIDSGLTDAMEAIVGNDCNIWLLVHDLYNTYKAYNITETGIDSTPVLSAGGNTMVDPSYFYSSVIASPNRQKIAAAGVYDMEVSDFDPATGVVSNSVFQPMPNGNYFVPLLVFSPNSTKLYSEEGNGSGCPGCSFGTDEIIQFDLSTPAPWTPVVADSTLTKALGIPTSGRLGPDGKIYMNNRCVINYPDSPGTACHVWIFPDSIANLPTSFGNASWSFPYNPSPVITMFDTIPDTHRLVTCFADTAVIMTADDTTGWNYTWSDYNKFRLHVYHRHTDTSGVFVLTYHTKGCQYHIDSFIVKFVAPYTVNLGPDTIFCSNSNFSYLLSPHDTVPGSTNLWQNGSNNSTYTATSPGTYWVTVIDTGCTVSDTVHIGSVSLNVNLGSDTTLCLDKPVSFNIQTDSIAGALYLWNTGSTAAAINIQDTGIYWVAVTDTPCIAADTIDIHGAYCDCAFGMPNAFTPNGDGKNDVFRPVIIPGCPVHGYLLTIYNRWGQMVFSSTNISQGWDGSFNGIPADIDTYEYVVQFEAGIDYQSHYQKGDLTLIR